MAQPIASGPYDLYLRLLEAEDEPYVELIDGEVVVNASSGTLHCAIASKRCATSCAPAGSASVVRCSWSIRS